MPEPIRDRGTITDHVAEWMHHRCPSFSIDTLLCHPDLAMEMGIDVAETAGRISAAQGKRLRRALRSLFEQQATADVVHEICRTALSSRKRGDLRRDAH